MRKLLAVLGVICTATSLQSCSSPSQTPPPPQSVGDWMGRDDDEGDRERRRERRDNEEEYEESEGGW